MLSRLDATHQHSKDPQQSLPPSDGGVGTVAQAYHARHDAEDAEQPLLNDTAMSNVQLAGPSLCTNYSLDASSRKVTLNDLLVFTLASWACCILIWYFSCECMCKRKSYDRNVLAYGQNRGICLVLPCNCAVRASSPKAQQHDQQFQHSSAHEDVLKQHMKLLRQIPSPPVQLVQHCAFSGLRHILTRCGKGSKIMHCHA